MPNDEGKNLPSYIAEQPGKGPWSSGGIAGSVTRGRGGYTTTTRKVLVYKIQVNPIHTILEYGDYYDFMDR